MTCAHCGKPLTYNELGLNKKYNGAKDGALCLGCLAQKLDVPQERLLEKIAEFLRAGCLLFVENS